MQETKIFKVIPVFYCSWDRRGEQTWKYSRSGKFFEYMEFGSGDCSNSCWTCL